MTTRRRKHWGWGFEDEQSSPDEVRAAAAGFAAHLGFQPGEVQQPVGLAPLRGAGAAVDPRGIMNPGVLIDPLS